MMSEMVMLVRGDEERFSDAKSFVTNADLMLAAQPGTTPFYVGVCDVLDGNEANPRVQSMETFGATVQALRTGDVDLVLDDGTAGNGCVDASDGGIGGAEAGIFRPFSVPRISAKTTEDRGHIYECGTAG